MPGAVLDRTIWAGVVVTDGVQVSRVGMDVQSGPVEAGEENLVDRLRAGDGAAFTRIVRDWSPAMIKVARQYVASHASAEEAVHETCQAGDLTKWEHLSVTLLLSTTIVHVTITQGEAWECRAPPFAFENGATIGSTESWAQPTWLSPGRSEAARLSIRAALVLMPTRNRLSRQDHPARATVIDGRPDERHARRIGVVLCVPAAAGPAFPSRQAHRSSARQADHGGSATNGRVATVRSPPVRTGPLAETPLHRPGCLSPRTS